MPTTFPTAIVPGPAIQIDKEDHEFEDVLQSYFSTLSGMPGNRFRPRWQPEPGNLPKYGSDWAAFGSTRYASDEYAAVVHDGDTETDKLDRHQVIDILISFYGPNSFNFAERLKDAMVIASNAALLIPLGLGFVEASNITHFSTLIKERWTNRADLTVKIKRQTIRVISRRNLEFPNGSLLYNEHYVTPIPIKTPA